MNRLLSPPALALALFMTMCAERMPSESDAEGDRESTLLLETARSFGQHDQRIAALLAKHDGGFDASLKSAGARRAEGALLAMTMPATADGRVRVGAANAPRDDIGFEALGASHDSMARFRDGNVTYQEVFVDTDLIAASNARLGEFLFLRRSRNAPSTFAWKVTLPAAVATVELRVDGLWFLDRSRDLVLHIPEPYAVDALGKRRPLALRWNEPSREVQVTLTGDDGLTYPMLVDPAFETAVWSQLATPPPAAGAQLVYDAALQQGVLFGGGLPLSQTWLFDGTSWFLRQFTEGDVFVPDGAVGVWDPKRQRIVAVGTSQTSVFDGTHWTQVAGTQPPERRGHAVAWDDVRGQIVLFGGHNHSGAPLGDTWTFDGAAWTAVGGPAPPPRTDHSLTWDAASKDLVLFGGANASGTWLNDTWTFDGAAWHPIAAAGNQPAPRARQSVAWDPIRKKLVMFGGDTPDFSSASDTWTFDGTGWTQQSSGPPARFAPTLVWDDTRSALVLFAGNTHNPSPVGDTWTFDGTSWAQVSSMLTPNARSDQAAMWDAARKRLTVFGGQNGAGLLGDTLVLGAAGWGAVVRASPSPRTGQRAVWDATRGRLVLYGGSTDVYSRGTVYNDTWIFDGTVWQQILGSTSPPPCSFYHKLAWHPASGDTVLFGGFCLSEGSTWVFGKSTWRTIASISTGPEPRWAHTLATEFGHGNVVLFGGFSLRGAGGVLGDTWTFDGNAWNAAPGPSPGSSGNTAQIRWDAKQHMPIMFGGFKAELATGTAAAWRFDGAAWQKVAAAAPPPDRSNFGMTWDAFHQRLVVFGGENDGRVALSDTWTLSGDTWTSAAGTSPSPRTGDQTLTESLLSWDGDRNKTVLFGGTGPNGVLGDTWTFDGQAWSEAVDPAQTSPPPRVAATFVYDPVRRRHILFGGRGIDGVLGDTWFFYLRGGSCTSGSQCGSGYCTDGVCCEARTCGVCQTCAGTSPGKCTVVLNAEDPDTCAIGHGKSCNAIGQCSGGPGVTCADGTTCGSGFCVDGVCCDSACNGACQACANTTKASGANAGHCEAAKAGSNPSSRCAGGAVCGETGSCITGASCSADGTQAVDAEGKNPTSCSPYKCAAGACPVMCASVDDCIAPAACTAAGHCELPSNDRGGGACSFAPERSRLPRSAAPAVLLFGFGATLARRRARSHRVRKKRSHAE